MARKSSSLPIALFAALLIHIALLLWIGWGWQPSGHGLGVAALSDVRRDANSMLMARLQPAANPVLHQSPPKSPNQAQRRAMLLHPQPQDLPTRRRSQLSAPPQNPTADGIGDAPLRVPASGDSTLDVDAVYWPAEALDTLAQVDPGFVLNVPTLADRPDLVGRVQLNLYVNERGGVDQVELVASNVPAEIADDLKHQFAQATFQPAIRHGQAARSLKSIEIRVGPYESASERAAS